MIRSKIMILGRKVFIFLEDELRTLLKTIAYTVCVLLNLNPASGLTGSMIRSEIVKELKLHNFSASPSIDTARQFPRCQSPLRIESIFGSWKTVQISCPSSDWKIAVRTNINRDTETFKKTTHEYQRQKKTIVALHTSMNRGEVIKESHLTYIKTQKNIGGGIFFDKAQLIGRTLKRPLSVGTIIRARHLNLSWVIEKNQIVTIEHQVGGIVINAKGIAQESGQVGERIWVNNFNSGKKVLCWIKNDNKVTTNAKVY